jgi:ribosomal protein S18 acetylase RimI-like enzyme
MADLRIIAYTVEDNESALSLEKQCVQGKSLVLRFQRPTFHARSEVYDKYRILCAKVGQRLIGIIAWTLKSARFRGEMIQAAYLYDLRVHPDHRRQGVATRLVRAALEEIGQEVDCIYTLIAGENLSALGLAQYVRGAKYAVPLTYAVIPVYKRLKEREDYQFTSVSQVHEMYLKMNPSTEFVPTLDGKRLLGYVTSIAIGEAMSGGCSIWTNENLLAEKVVAVPRRYQIGKVLTMPLRPFLRLPYVPKPTDTIQSWFLFDFCARDGKGVRSLLAAVNNIALSRDRKLVYILLQNSDPMLTFVRRSGHRVFTFPYVFLAMGRVIPTQTDKVYIDIRDL